MSLRRPGFIVLKSSYFDRCERSYRPMLAFVTVDVSVRIGRSKTTFFYAANKMQAYCLTNFLRVCVFNIKTIVGFLAKICKRTIELITSWHVLYENCNH